jgi:hypothetical protein
MTKINGFSEELTHILSEMCAWVGANPEKIDFKNPNWYWEYSWTREQQDDFRKWLANYLYTNTKARNAIMNFPRKNKKYCEKTAFEFILWYGWKEKENDTESKSIST